MITSFSNPNYQLNDADALNSNLPASQYYHDNSQHIYDEPANLTTSDTSTTSSGTNSASKRRKNYGNVDSNQLGVEGIDGQGGYFSPDSMTSEGQYSMESGFTSPGGTQSMVEIEHTEQDSEPESSTGSGTPSETRKAKGFLGYYASLQQSVKERNAGKPEVEVESDGGDMSECSGATPMTPAGVTPITPASTASSAQDGSQKR